MPLFEYQCQNCHREFEELVSSSKGIPQCPQCQSKKVKKLISQFNTGKSCSCSHGSTACSHCKK